MIQPFKFIVQAVLLETDETGKPVGEHIAEPVALYGKEALRDWAETFDEKLAELEAQTDGGTAAKPAREVRA
jgi:histidinol dehydrogenase